MEVNLTSLAPSPTTEYSSRDNLSKQNPSFKDTWQSVRAAASSSRVTHRKPQAFTRTRQSALQSQNNDAPRENEMEDVLTRQIRQAVLEARKDFLQRRISEVILEVTSNVELAVAKISSNINIEAYSSKYNVRFNEEASSVLTRWAKESGAQARDELLWIVRDAERDGTDLTQECTDIRVFMGSVDGVPRYDSWVPVKSCHWVGPNMPFEPYMPYFGDTEEDRAKVFNLYRNLLRDNDHCVGDLSDMEADENEENGLKEPQTEEEWTDYDALDAAVERAAVRFALGRVTSMFGSDSQTLSIVSEILNVKPIKRVARILKTMKARSSSWDIRVAKEQKALSHERDIVTFLNQPVVPKHVIEGSSKLMNWFCRTCMIFGCEQHASLHVGPPQALADPRADERNKLWAPGAHCILKPCGVYCRLREDALLALRAKEDDFDWSPEEIALVKKATKLFKKDVCGVSRVVGGKSCGQCYEFLRPKSNQDCGNGYQRDGASMRNEQTQTKKRKTSRRPKKTGSSKGRTDSKGEQMEKDFVPCDHVGDCMPDVCECVSRGIRCQASCGCNSVRWTMAKLSHRIGTLCKNRQDGCDCRRGRCSTEMCPCWRENRACDPDLCNHCGASLPVNTSMLEGDRRCQNVSVTVLKRKRTFVGKSTIHGLGLFAGERFYKGDLIGVYLGQALDTDIADVIGRIYEAKDHTFFFDLTESIVVDGGPFGSKTKFVNHIPSVDVGSNCGSRLVRVRGQPYIALYARKTIEPGAEFAFDYQFRQVVPHWAKSSCNDDDCLSSLS